MIFNYKMYNKKQMIQIYAGKVFIDSDCKPCNKFTEKGKPTIVLRCIPEFLDDFLIEYFLDLKQTFLYGKQHTNSDIDMSGIQDFSCKEDIYSKNPSIKFYFKTEEDRNIFKSFHSLSGNKNSYWYPKTPIKEEETGCVGFTSDSMQLEYPFYIPSYKRYDSLLTVLTLESLGIENYKVVIRYTEEELYRKSMTDKKIKNVDSKLLVMSKEYIEYQQSIGNDNSVIPRKYGFDYYYNKNFKFSWCLDDNIQNFYVKYNGKASVLVKTKYAFKLVEQMTKRYSNVLLFSIQYRHLSRNGIRNQVIKNSKQYSCILHNNSIKDILGHSWRKKHNEDVRLTLDVLSSGYGTLCFENILCGKVSTGGTKGGNEELYKNKNGKQERIDELREDYDKYISSTKQQKNGVQFIINYNSFKNNDLGYISDIKIDLPNLVKLNL